MVADGTYRTAALKYGVGDNVRQKFTGYERDEETGLDFAEARYYYNNHGRFTAVDPLLASGKSANPQTFNRYAYVMNRPFVYTDPTGLQAGALLEPASSCPTSGCWGYADGKGGVTANQPLAQVTVTAEKSLLPTPSGEVSTNIQMPPIGFGMEQRMTRELQAMGQALVDGAKTAAWRIIPDSVEASVSTPLFSGGLELSKDGNLFLGGQVTYGSSLAEFLGDTKSSTRAIYPKLSAGIGAKYFYRDLRESQRDDAISGPDFEVQAGPFTFATPLTGDGHPSLKIGNKGFGIGGSYTSTKIFDAGDAISGVNRFFTYKRPEEEK